MNRPIISVILASALAASSLASCTSPTSPAASSSATETPSALFTRLTGEVPDNAVLACGEDAEKYADLSSLRDDGYIIRRTGDGLFILAAAEDGLDRGIRCYANHVPDSGDYFRTYGEGAKIKSLTVASRDIADFVIVMDNSRDTCHEYAASELRRLIGDACGTYPDIVGNAGAHNIFLEQITTDDPRYATLKNDGFTIETDASGDLHIVGGIWQGCLFGVYEFAEAYLGWRFSVDEAPLNFSGEDYHGYMHEYLAERDSVDIPAGLSDTQTPSFGFRYAFRSTLDHAVKEKNGFFINHPEYNGYGITRAASHGVVKPFLEYGGGNTAYDPQPCFTDPDFRDFCIEWYGHDLDTRLAAGEQIGKEITDIDVAQIDSAIFCECAACRALVKKDGSNTGPVLDFTNMMAEWVAENYSPDIYALMLVYHGTTAVPKVTRPRENVSGAYCFIESPPFYPCYNHCLDGVECAACGNEKAEISNCNFAAEIRGWCEICTRMTVWYYPCTWAWDGLLSSTVHNIYDDMRFLYSLGVYGVYNCAPGDFGGFNPEEAVVSHMLAKLMWNCDMTREEYDAEFADYIRTVCGDGYEEILAYYDLQKRWSINDCWSTHAWSAPNERVNFPVMRDMFDTAVALFDSAAEDASCAAEEQMIERMSLTTYFTGLVASHTAWYEYGDGESRAKYEGYFKRFLDLADRYGFTLSTNESFDSPRQTIPQDFDISKNLGTLYGWVYRASETWWND